MTEPRRQILVCADPEEVELLQQRPGKFEGWLIVDVVNAATLVGRIVDGYAITPSAASSPGLRRAVRNLNWGLAHKRSAR